MSNKNPAEVVEALRDHRHVTGELSRPTDAQLQTFEERVFVWAASALAVTVETLSLCGLVNTVLPRRSRRRTFCDTVFFGTALGFTRQMLAARVSFLLVAA